MKIKLHEDTIEAIIVAVARELKIKKEQISAVKIAKKSVDARKKDDVHFVYSVDVNLKRGEEKLLLRADKNKVRKIFPHTFETVKVKNKPDVNPVICGFGPAGMFCALMLARAGLEPIILERGADVDTRSEVVEKFFGTGFFDKGSNVQFGEGGAGTFSDGKLTCGVNDSRMEYILSQFVHFGANDDILYSAKPHIGTDVLRIVVKNMREEIISLGGRVIFGAKLCDMKIVANKICSVTYEKDSKCEEIGCNMLVMAIGHSARDTFELIFNKGLNMIQKQFSIGVRVEHLQSMINKSQYGNFASHKALGAADYKLSCKTNEGRGVYTFCMCPGGSVVAATSEENMVVTNGMSYHARDGKNANAAMLCDVYASDFGSEHPLAGVEFQRKWERAAYEVGGRNYKAPASLVGDFLQKRVSTSFGEIEPTYKPGVAFAELDECLPSFATEALRQAFLQFDRRISGFASHDAIMTGVETRSSSPVRIVRDEKYESNIEGIFPCGEGAGYAGGIMSAALDGIKVSEQIIMRLK